MGRLYGLDTNILFVVCFVRWFTLLVTVSQPTAWVVDFITMAASTRIESRSQKSEKIFDPSKKWGGLGAAFISECTGLSVDDIAPHIDTDEQHDNDEGSSSETEEDTQSDTIIEKERSEMDIDSDQTGDSTDGDNFDEELIMANKTKKNILSRGSFMEGLVGGVPASLRTRINSPPQTAFCWIQKEWQVPPRLLPGD
jgi:hypothetical protein